MYKTDHFLEILKYFCESTTIHGLDNIRTTKWPWKIGWLIVVLAMLSCSTWFCTESVLQYLRFDIRTTITYNSQHEVEFPAVTFCNQHHDMRSAYAHSDALKLSLSLFSARSLHDIEQIHKDTEKVCKTNNPGPYDNLSLEDIMKMGLVEDERLFGLDSFRSVVKCWWAREEFECNGSFANCALDQGFCFTFMSSKKVARLVESQAYSKMMYGSNESHVIDRNVSNSGVQNGLQLLFRVNQEESCDAAKKNEGAGFKAILHDVLNLSPVFALSSAISLLPGYTINVMLTPTVFHRKTATLGLCVEPKYLIDGVKTYFKTMCYYICYIKILIDDCKCVPRFFMRGIDETLSTIYSINISPIRNCSQEDTECVMLNLAKIDSSNNFAIYCSACLPPCYETAYKFLVTYQQFPSHNVVNLFKNEFNESNVTNIRKNYLIFNIFFDSLTVETVVETQDFTLSDLFMYIGGVLCLFMGMSFMSFGDIAQFMAQDMFQLLKNMISSTPFKFKNTKKKQVRQRCIFTLNVKQYPKIVHSSNIKVSFMSFLEIAQFSPQDMFQNDMKKVTTKKQVRHQQKHVFTKTSKISQNPKIVNSSKKASNNLKELKLEDIED